MRLVNVAIFDLTEETVSRDDARDELEVLNGADSEVAWSAPFKGPCSPELLDAPMVMPSGTPDAFE